MCELSILSLHQDRPTALQTKHVSVSGILPVNAHAEVNLLNLNYITALYFILLPLYFQMIYTTINNGGACCICFKALYFHNLSVLSAVLPQTGNTSEHPFCRLIEAFVLDL